MRSAAGSSDEAGSEGSTHHIRRLSDPAAHRRLKLPSTSLSSERGRILGGVDDRVPGGRVIGCALGSSAAHMHLTLHYYIECGPIALLLLIRILLFLFLTSSPVTTSPYVLRSANC